MGSTLSRQEVRSLAYPHPSSRAVSAVMRANRSRDTLPELRLRSVLHRSGFRFRANARVNLDELRVRPDIVFFGHRVAVFLDGCFWHSCPRHGNLPRTNPFYWLPKLKRVRDRDRRVNAALKREGWQVLRLWEHEPLERAARSIALAMRKPPRQRKAVNDG